MYPSKFCRQDIQWILFDLHIQMKQYKSEKQAKKNKFVRSTIHILFFDTPKWTCGLVLNSQQVDFPNPKYYAEMNNHLVLPVCFRREILRAIRIPLKYLK